MQSPPGQSGAPPRAQDRYGSLYTSCAGLHPGSESRLRLHPVHAAAPEKKDSRFSPKSIQYRAGAVGLWPTWHRIPITCWFWSKARHGARLPIGAVWLANKRDWNSRQGQMGCQRGWASTGTRTGPWTTRSMNRVTNRVVVLRRIAESRVLGEGLWHQVRTGQFRASKAR